MMMMITTVMKTKITDSKLFGRTTLTAAGKSANAQDKKTFIFQDFDHAVQILEPYIWV